MTIVTPPCWEQRTPLALSPTNPLLPFPIDALPEWLADYVQALAHFTQTPVDLPGTVALGVLAACAGGRVIVEVRPGYKEPVNLYILVVSPSGTRKSPTFRVLLAPLRDAEARLKEKAGPSIVEAQARKHIAEKAAEKARQRPGGKDHSQTNMAEAIELAQAAAQIVVPPFPRLLADDVTPEAAVSLLAEQGGRLTIASAEGGLFSILAGRYSDNVPNAEWALKGHSGDTIQVDRKSRCAEEIDAPALTLIQTVQPDVLKSVVHHRGLRERGLPARFLYSLPENNVGDRIVGTAPVPPEVSDVYHQNIFRLAPMLQ